MKENKDKNEPIAEENVSAAVRKTLPADSSEVTEDDLPDLPKDDTDLTEDDLPDLPKDDTDLSEDDIPDLPEDDTDWSEDDIPDLPEDDTDWSGDDTDWSEDDIPAPSSPASPSDGDSSSDGGRASDGDSSSDDGSSSRRGSVARVFCRILTVLACIAGAAALVYLGGCFYYSGHYLPNTSLNGTDVSSCSPEKARERLAAAAADYTLTISGRDGLTATLPGSEISYSISCDEDLAAQIRAGSPFRWPLQLWTRTELSASCAGFYDAAQLREKVSALPFFRSENIRQPGDAVCSYTDGSYQVVAGDPGTVPLEDGILQTIEAALSAGLSEVTLGDDCYREAALTPDNAQLQETCAVLNQILDMTVTISFDDKEETLTREQLASFIAPPATAADSAESTSDTAGTASDDSSTASDSNTASADTESVLSEEEQLQAEMEARLSNIDFQDTAITEYVASLAESYDTYGKDREFTTHDGETVTVAGGDYGWQMDQEGTVTVLKAFLTAGESGSFEPVWTKEAASFGDTDIGDTYAEVNLDHQKVYLYVEGKCILETDCVSGKAIDADRITPTGTYSINYRKSPAVLKGADYESPVTFWMPFNRGVGFHDATWRSKFGGSIYLASGSHGCVNLPYSAAETLYENVYSGMPVVVYGGMTAEEAQEYTGRKPDPPVSVKESETDIGGGEDPSSADSSAQTDADAAAAQAAQDAQTAVLQQAIQNYMDQGMSAAEAQAQVQADLAAQYAAQQAAAGQ